MINEVSLLTEGQTAVCALPGFLVEVYETVALQFVLYAESTIADVASVRLLAGVLGHVDDEGRSRAETLVAVAALEREEIRVRSIVNEERGFLLESLAADVADERTLARVYAPMILDVPLRREHSAANVAGKFFYAGVSLAKMTSQALVDAKLLAAQVTSERPLARVDSHVPGEGVRGEEILPAVVAVIVYTAVGFHPRTAHQILVDAALLPAAYSRRDIRVILARVKLQQFFLSRCVVAVWARIDEQSLLRRRFCHVPRFGLMTVRRFCRSFRTQAFPHCGFFLGCFALNGDSLILYCPRTAVRYVPFQICFSLEHPRTPVARVIFLVDDFSKIVRASGLGSCLFVLKSRVAGVSLPSRVRSCHDREFQWAILPGRVSPFSDERFESSSTVGSGSITNAGDLSRRRCREIVHDERYIFFSYALSRRRLFHSLCCSVFQ